MLNLLRNLLRDDAPPVAPPAPRETGVRRPQQSEQLLVPELTSAQRSWDGSDVCDELDAYLVAADRREWDAVALLVERLNGGTPFEQCLTAPFREASAVPLLLSPLLLLRLSPTLSSFVLLKLFARGVRTRTACGDVCTKAAAVASVLRLLALLAADNAAVPPTVSVAQLVDAALACLHELLVHNVTARDVSAILSTLHSASGAHVDGFTQRVLRTLSDVMTAELAVERSRASFLCDGGASGLVTVVQGPPRGALTLLLWVRIEAMPMIASHGGGEDAVVPLFSLNAAGGPASGVALGFHVPTRTLLLRATANGRVTTTRTSPAQALANCSWTSVGIVMSRATLLSDSVNVFVDGTLLTGCSLPFPPAMGDGAPQRLCLGCWTPGQAPGPLTGLIGSCTLFGYACSTDDMAALHAASCRGQLLTPPSSTLSDRRTREQQPGGAGGIANSLPRKLTERGHHRLFAAIDPSATDATCTTWTVPTRTGASQQVQLLQPGTSVAITQSLATALASTGGPAALLPLLLRHNMPLSPPPGEDVATCMFPPLSPSDACRLLPLPPTPSAGVSPSVSWAVIHLMPHVLPAAAPGEVISAVRCVATVLRCGEPKATLSPQLAAHLLELTRVVDATKVCVARDGAPEWEPAALLLLDIPLWRAAGLDGRRAHYGALKSYLDTASDSMASAFGGEFLCHFLRSDDDVASSTAGDCNPSDERLALLRIVQGVAENSNRPGVRAVVCRQLLRFVHAAATSAGESAVHTDILLACAQLLIASVVRELGPPAANSGNNRPAMPPLASSPDNVDVSKASSCLQLLVAGGGIVAAVLARCLKAHPSPAVASIAMDLRAAVFNADANAASAADGVVAGWTQSKVDLNTWLSTLLAPVPAFADARMCASAAQAWCAGRSGRGHAYKVLRRLVTVGGPWTSICADSCSNPAHFPGGRLFWRLEDDTARDGARRRLLPLERDACWTSAARVHDNDNNRVGDSKDGMQVGDTPESVLSVGRDGASPRDAASVLVVLPASRSAEGAQHRLDEEDDAALYEPATPVPQLLGSISEETPEPEGDHEHTDDEGDNDVDDHGADTPPATPEMTPQVSAASEAATAGGTTMATPGGSTSAEAEQLPQASATPALPQQQQMNGDDGDLDFSAFSLNGNPAALLARLRARAGAAATAAAVNVANVAAQASRRMVNEAMDKAKGASSTVALAQELVAEHLSLVQTAAVPAACTQPPLPPWVLHPRGLPKCVVSYSAIAEWVRADNVRPGTILVASGHVVFIGANGEGNGCVLPLALLSGMQLRRRHMRRCALEVFLNDGRTFLFNLPAPPSPSSSTPATPAAGATNDSAAAARERASALHHAIMLQRPLCGALPHARTLLPPARLVERAGWTRAWQRREMSTFEYLMHLNHAAGRSFNDMSQYPVFPWVLADYTSPELDLSNPASFRDFTLPMGAQTATRRAAVTEFYASLRGGETIGGDLPAFHHGTHYSTPGGVLHLLMRLEPYASMHVQLQSGSFDYADRLLHNVDAAWRSATSTSHDVKELVPEWFTCPDVLRNVGNLPLGRRQDGTVLGDVQLPPWAKGRPEEFIRLHRAALECDHVSANIHHWIDLIFGCKQRGPAAVDALNLFFYTSYEGAVDFTALSDEHQRTVYTDQLTHFGQTPMQLFREAHPPRGAAPPDAPYTVAKSAANDPSEALLAIAATAHDGCPVVALAFVHGIPNSGASAGGGGGGSGTTGALTSSHLCSVDAQGRLLVFKAPASTTRSSGSGAASKSAASAPGLEPQDGTAGDVRKESLGPVLPAGWSTPLPTGLTSADTTRWAASHLVAPAPDMGGLLTCGWSDGTILSFGRDNRNRQRPASRAAQLAPRGVTATCVAYDAGFLIVGGSDGSVCMYRGPTVGGTAASEPDRPAMVIRAHSVAVTFVAACAQADVLAAGAFDGRCALFTLGSGTLLRTLPPAPGPIFGMAISPVDGSVAVHSMPSEGRPPSVAVFTQGGSCLVHIPLIAPLLALGFTSDGAMLMTATPVEGICLRWAHNLEPAAPLVRSAGAAPVTCASLSPDGTLIAVGAADGSVAVYRTPRIA